MNIHGYVLGVRMCQALQVAGGFTAVASPRVVVSPRGVPTRQPFQAGRIGQVFFFFRILQIIARSSIYQWSLMTAEHVG